MNYPAKFLFIVFISIIFSSCSDEKNKTENSGSRELLADPEGLKKDSFILQKKIEIGSVILSDTNYVVLSYSLAPPWIFKARIGTSISGSDIVIIDSLIKIGANEFNLKNKKFIDSLNKTLYRHSENKFTGKGSVFPDKYKKQCYPYVNSNGETEVWVNCFCDGPWKFDWRKEPLGMVRDGGNCFFQVKINLSKKTFSEFHVNDNG
ncbi:MAG: hypothetical protein IAF38_00250 [Bacteroidia bacterium]|nr:hypothetical protein [Bacteroidia bacterium]